MNYLIYEEYASMGGVLDVTAFNRNIDRASLMIDVRTQGRLQRETLFDSYEDALKVTKLVCRDLLDYISVHSVEKKVVTSRSESAGPVSESESYATKTAEDYAADIDRILEPLHLVKTKNFICVDYAGAMS